MKRISDIRITTFEQDNGSIWVAVTGADSGEGDIERVHGGGIGWTWAILRCLKRMGAFNHKNYSS